MKSILVAILLLPALLLAQGSSTGASHLKLAGSARSLAMGQSTIADPHTFSSLSLNPANISAAGSIELLLSHTQWIQDIKTEFLGTQIPALFGTWSFSIANTSVGNIELRDRPGPAIATFSSRSTVFQLSFARAVTQTIAVGASAKYLYEKIYVDETTGLAADVGLLYTTPLEGLTTGIAVANFGSLQKFRLEDSDLPAEFRVGATYKYALNSFIFALSGGIAGELHSSQNHILLGCEAEYDQVVAVRLGYQSGFETRGLSGGFGLRYALVKLDYAYLPFSFGLGDAHIVTLGFQF